mmetsp:Transcript_162430/g.287792  ORF Transcript_162430/g.287792 Transcript_162430/m.287792 type:complete len:88 (+) Transcript_162430:459-722(+)
MTAMTVAPTLAAASFSDRTTSCDVVLSNPLVGSSAKRSSGCVTNSMAIDTRFRCPPEMPRRSALPTRCPAMADRLSSCSTSSTQAST